MSRTYNRHSKHPPADMAAERKAHRRRQNARRRREEREAAKARPEGSKADTRHPWRRRMPQK